MPWSSRGSGSTGAGSRSRVHTTRTAAGVSFGAGPRASQNLVLAAKARAILAGRYAVAIEDVRALAMPILIHRVLPNFHAEADGVTARNLIDRLLELVRPR